MPFSNGWRKNARVWKRKPAWPNARRTISNGPPRSRSPENSAATTTLLFGGLTWKHEKLVHGALEGLGYRAEAVPTPNVKAFQAGKEYGNNGQCNPTYFTVGNLVQYLQSLEEQGLDQAGNHRPVRVLHRRRVRPLPLRHV